MFDTNFALAGDRLAPVGVKGSTPKPDGEIECVMCGDTFTETDLTGFREMGEAYHRDKRFFLCPDCWDAFRRMPLEEQARVAITDRWKEADTILRG